MKFRGNPKKYLPALGFLPTAVLAVCIAVSLGDYTAPVLSLDAVGESAEKSTETSTTEKRRERKTAAVTTKAPAPAVEKLSESGTYKDGTYTGTGTGFSGTITVQVVIEDGKIKDITILSATDDSPYLQNASALLKQIVALQSTNVDIVSGATYSSVGLISAVRDALQKADCRDRGRACGIPGRRLHRNRNRIWRRDDCAGHCIGRQDHRYPDSLFQG